MKMSPAPALAAALLLLFAGSMLGSFEVTDLHDLFKSMAQALTNIVIGLAGYYYGSSQGSQKKDDTIASALNPPPGTTTVTAPASSTTTVTSDPAPPPPQPEPDPPADPAPMTRGVELP